MLLMAPNKMESRLKAPWWEECRPRRLPPHHGAAISSHGYLRTSGPPSTPPQLAFHRVASSAATLRAVGLPVNRLGPLGGGLGLLVGQTPQSRAFASIGAAPVSPSCSRTGTSTSTGIESAAGKAAEDSSRISTSAIA